MKYRSALEKVFTEIKVLSLANHPRIPKLYDYFEDEFDDKIYLVLQLAEKGEIADWNYEDQVFDIKIPHTKQLEESSLKKVLAQTIDALVHRR